MPGIKVENRADDLLKMHHTPMPLLSGRYPKAEQPSGLQTKCEAFCESADRVPIKMICIIFRVGVCLIRAPRYLLRYPPML